jgi:hypothetical protein
MMVDTLKGAALIFAFLHHRRLRHMDSDLGLDMASRSRAHESKHLQGSFRSVTDVIHPFPATSMHMKSSIRYGSSCASKGIFYI